MKGATLDRADNQGIEVRRVLRPEHQPETSRNHMLQLCEMVAAMADLWLATFGKELPPAFASGLESSAPNPRRVGKEFGR
jgi:hypothetical protein